MSQPDQTDRPFNVNQTPEPSSSEIPRAGARNIPLAIAWAILAGTAGGYACGLAINTRFGEIASASLWALGVLAGYVGRKIITAPSRLVGWVLVAACVCALVIAETCWIHWRWPTAEARESWWAAFTLLPTFVQEYQLAALFAAIFTCFGASSAYRATAIRYRLVAVEDR
jgi:hypothetical protein